MDYLYTLSGFGVGAIVGLTGVGGGSLMTPLLVLLFGVPPATAVGTDLLYAALTKGGGSWVHHRHGNVDWALAGRLALGSVPAAGLTATIAGRSLVDVSRDVLAIARDGLKARNALYFDGSISRLYAPQVRRNDFGWSMGPIIGLVDGAS